MNDRMTEEEWRVAEQREPGRIYLVPDYSHAEPWERLAYAIFAVGALVIVVWGGISAFVLT